jgi:hypothetical protein
MPPRAKRLAVASPIPEPPPVTSAVRLSVLIRPPIL